MHVFGLSSVFFLDFLWSLTSPRPLQDEPVIDLPFTAPSDRGAFQAEAGGSASKKVVPSVIGFKLARGAGVASIQSPAKLLTPELCVRRQFTRL